jgi:hypothetical protein
MLSDSTEIQDHEQSRMASTRCETEYCDKWQATFPAHLEELPPGLIADEI